MQSRYVQRNSRLKTRSAYNQKIHEAYCQISNLLIIIATVSFRRKKINKKDNNKDENWRHKSEIVV